MSIVLLGATSGSVTLAEPAVGGSTVIDIPAASGTMVVTGSSPSLANVTATGNLSVSGNTTLGDASTDTVLMTGAPSIGGAGLGMGMGFRNRIINGAMVISQRGTTFTQSTANQVGLDRWDGTGTAASKFTFAQSATAPAGFNNSTLITSLSAYSVTSGDLFLYRQRIEGYNVADLGFGTADAQTITVSFWVRSSLTGSFGGYLGNGSLNRSYLFSYTISSANTWEKKTVTIAGDTSGTWLTTNGLGIEVGFSLGAGATYSSTANTWAGTFYIQPTGATSVVGTNGATFYITGVQLEKGSTATSFDYRDYGRELALCQRYYCKLSGSNGRLGMGYNATTTEGSALINFPVSMRTPPTALEQSGTASDYGTQVLGSTGINSSVPTFQGASTNNATAVSYFQTGLVAGQGGLFSLKAGSGYLAFSAEL